MAANASSCWWLVPVRPPASVGGAGEGIRARSSFSNPTKSPGGTDCAIAERDNLAAGWGRCHSTPGGRRRTRPLSLTALAPSDADLQA